MGSLIVREALHIALTGICGCGAEKTSWAEGWDAAIAEAIRLLERQPEIVKEVEKKNDCSNFEVFCKERKRMCDSLKCKCRECDIFHARHESIISCQQWCVDHSTEALAIVQKWSDEHPRKTRMSEFIKLHPSAVITDYGIPAVCYELIDRNEDCTHGVFLKSIEKCKMCWNTPIE